MSEPDALLLSDLARTLLSEGRPVTPGGSSLTTSGDSAGRTSSSSSSLSLRRLTTSTISTPDGSAVNEIRGCLFDSAPFVVVGLFDLSLSGATSEQTEPRVHR